MEQKQQDYWAEDGTDRSDDLTNLSAPAAGDEVVTGEPEVFADWEASEYIHREKGALWFVGLSLLTLAGAGASVYFGQYIFALLIVTMAAAIWVYARRPPRQVHYVIDEVGISIDGKIFPFEEFRGYSIVQEEGLYSIRLRPMKRFMPGITMYFVEQDGEMIVDALSEFLPAEEMKQDLMDKLMHWLRF